ncbi:MAG: SGNH/GDSL hydrolase family protein [Candidatus Goldbacteria bacterium]|nr:SGNH/GDSL hydrolase family protein [Candidatus Goldiibacteriota bacterium]
MIFKNKLKYIFLILFGFFIAFFIIEIFVRIFDKNPDIILKSIYKLDSKTGLIVYKPKKEFEYNTTCFSNKFKFNSLGWRDQEFDLEKGKNVYRILAVGDSFVASLEIPLEKTFHYLLEQKLNEHFKNKNIKFEVLSISKGGNGMYYNYRYLKDYGIKYNPDLILMFTFRNDFLDDMREMDRSNNYSIESILGRGSFKITDGKLIDKYSRYNNALFGQLFFGIRSNLAFPHFFYRKFSSLVYKIRGAENIDINYLKNNLKEIEEIEDKVFEKIKLVALENNLNIIFFNIIDNSIYKEDNTGLVSIENHKEIIKKLVNKYNFKFIDLKDYFLKRYQIDRKDFILSCDYHWNELGHSYMADAIFENLLKEINF